MVDILSGSNNNSKFSSQSNTPANHSKDVLAAPDKVLSRVIKCPNLYPKYPCMGTNGSDNIEGTGADEFIYGLKGDDNILAFSSVSGPSGSNYNDHIDGGEGADSLYGGANPDFIIGGPGDDMIYGGDGNDGLVGGEGNDHIYGGDGNDQIWGQKGQDTIYGGEGNDKIYHDNSIGSALYDFSAPDGYKDFIDCGLGIDEVWINTASDGDVAINCEIIHTSHPKVDSGPGNLTNLNKLAPK
jgi:Ca2+-binding RTX toxin-like protein